MNPQIYLGRCPRRNYLQTHSYTTIIDGLCEAGRLKDAQNLSDGMQNGMEVADVVTYSTLLDGLCKRRRLDEAIESFPKNAR